MDIGATGSYLASRIMIVVVFIGACITAVYAGVNISDENLFPILIGVLAIVALVWVLISGENYWMLLPLAFSMQVPAVPMGGRSFEFSEIVAVACFVLMGVRMAFRKQDAYTLRFEHFFLGCYLLWAFFIYVRNPIGLLIFGSSVGGLRFYAKLALVFMAYFVISNQQLSEKQSKKIVWLILVGSLLSMAYGIYSYLSYAQGHETMFGDENLYTWHQAVAAPSALWFIYLIAHFGLPRLLSLGGMPLAVSALFFVFIAFQSGKRAIFACILIMPILVATLRRQWIYVFLGVTGAGLLLTFLVMGHGTLFHLPYRMQRTLANLPGNWDKDIQAMVGSGSDTFRTKMNDKAYDQIKTAPWIGDGFKVSTEEFNRIMVVSSEQSGQDEMLIEMLAKGSSWHNTWLGMSADFGIPAAIIYFFFYVQVIWLFWWLFKRTKMGTYRHTLTMITGLSFFSQMLTSWTGGHSALTPYAQWWMYGLMVALRYSLLAEKRQEISSVNSREDKAVS